MEEKTLRRSMILSLTFAGLLWNGPLIERADASPRGVVFDQDVNLGGQGTFRHEPSIAFNPANPANLVVAFPEVYPFTVNPPDLCRAAWTKNDGHVWHLGGVTPLQQRPGASGVACGDPSIAADSQGNFYLAYLNANFGFDSFPWDVFVAKSTDGGRSFSGFSVAVHGQSGVNDADKPYIGADAQPASPFNGNLYVAWSDLAAGPIEVVVSRDGGQTWSTPTPLSTSNTTIGSVPVVAPDGTAYVFWLDYTPGFANRSSIEFSRSVNGGATWSAPAAVASRLPSPGLFNLKNADPAFGSDPFAGLVSNSFPTAAIAPDGTLYVAWTDFPEGRCKKLDRAGDFSCTNADVRLSVSRDGGSTWTSPVKVSDDGASGADQFFPWIAAHPDGLLSISFLDRRLDPGNVNYDAFYTNTTDGATFLPNVRVSSVSSTLGAAGFIGDYTGLAAPPGKVFPAWGDHRFDQVTDFTARGTLQP